MEKTNALSEREKLPTIYSSNAIHLKSLSKDIKNNALNNLDFSIYNKNSKININNYCTEVKPINSCRFEKHENLKNYMKIDVNNKDEKNTDKKNILSYYSNNDINSKKSNIEKILEKFKYKNNNMNNSNLSNRNSYKNKKKISLFGDSYYNYLLNLRRKKEGLNIKENDKKEILNENNKDEVNPSVNNNIINSKNNIIDNNNFEKFYQTNTLDINNISNSKTPNKYKIINNNNQLQNLYNSDRSNVYGIINDNYNSNKFYSVRNNSLSNKKICPLCNKDIDYYRYRSHLNMHPSKIFDWLYLGSYKNACNIKDLKDLKINFILNCAAECQNKNLPPEISCFHAKISDSPLFQINTFFDKTNSFINTAKLSGGSILIHCQLGISRSTTCLIAYMIKYLGYTTLSALQFIKNKRPHVMPNFGFIHQLNIYENKIKLGEIKNITKNEDIMDENSIKNDVKFNLFIKQHF